MTRSEVKAFFKRGKYIYGINKQYVAYCLRRRFPIPVEAVSNEKELIEMCGYFHRVANKYGEYLCTEENKRYVTGGTL